MLVVRGGGVAGAVELARDRLVERVDQERGLAAAGHAGDAGEQAERDFGVDVLQVVAARIDDLQRALRGRACAARGISNAAFAGEILAGERMPVRHDVVGRALRDDLAAMHAGAGADVEHIVGEADGVLVMLDHDHGVAEVAQALQRFKQPRIVALVQADATARPAHKARR